MRASFYEGAGRFRTGTAPEPTAGAGEAVLQKDDIDLSLIVLDLDLGGENGLMLMKHLKRHHPDAPIIIYTGMEPDEPAIRRMRDQGADQCLRKGTMSELVAAVQSAAD